MSIQKSMARSSRSGRRAFPKKKVYVPKRSSSILTKEAERKIKRMLRELYGK